MNADDDLIYGVYSAYHTHYMDSAMAVQATSDQLEMTRDDVMDVIERAENL